MLAVRRSSIRTGATFVALALALSGTAAGQAASAAAAAPRPPLAPASVSAAATTPLCPADVAVKQSAALKPADYEGFSYPVLYDAAGRCVSTLGRIPTDVYVSPGDTITATSHIYYTNRRGGTPAGTGKLPTTVSFKITDCLNRVTTINYPGQVKAPYLPYNLSNAEYQDWVETHPNPISISFPAPSEGCVREADDSGWANWKANVIVETDVTVVGGSMARSLAGLCVDGAVGVTSDRPVARAGR